MLTSAQILFHLKEWADSVAVLSSPTSIINHPIGKLLLSEKDVDRVILDQFRQNNIRTPWLVFLAYYFNGSPVKEYNKGRVPKMVNDWINWDDIGRPKLQPLQ